MIKLGINPDGTPFARLTNGELHTIQGWIDAAEDFSEVSITVGQQGVIG